MVMSNDDLKEKSSGCGKNLNEGKTSNVAYSSKMLS